MSLIIFADDTSFIFKADTIISLKNVFNYKMIKINNWFINNKLYLYIKKTNHMIFNNFNNNQLDICIGKNIIDQVDYVKFLGVYVDYKLNWKKDIHSLRCKLSKIISVFHKLKNKLNASTLLILCKSLFMSSLSYCIQIWGQAYKSNTNYINVLQNRALRIIYKINLFKNIDYIYKKLNILKFNDLKKVYMLNYMYKAFHNKLPNIVQVKYVKKYSR